MWKYGRLQNPVCGLWLSAFLAVCPAAISHAARGQGKTQYLAREQAYRYENESVYAVYADETGEYSLSVEGSGADKAVLRVNGIVNDGKISNGRARIALQKGINSISLTDGPEQGEEGITGIAVEDCPQLSGAGAFVTYVSYEAEDGKTNAKISGDDREYRSFASEASGRSYVALKDEEDYVTVTLTEPADALVIRYCIPDSADGTGLTGTVDLFAGDRKQELVLSSELCWVYGAFPWNNNPSTSDDGGGHLFYNDVRVKLDRVCPAGTDITIRKGTSFDYCLIDLVEAEQLEAPLPMPENALSVEDFGAAADDGEDDAMAIVQCVAAAAEQGKDVYVPAGEYEIRNNAYFRGLPLRMDHVTIRGAGMWHTVLKGEASGFLVQAEHVHFYDFSIIGNVKQRKDSIDPPAFNMTEPRAGVGDIRLQNIWIEHYKVGLWADVVNGISIMGCRIRNTYADGINLCGGTSHCVVTQNDLRSTGDDAIAMFNRGVLCEDNKVSYNTAAIPWLANNIALYGGRDIEITHNLLKDTVCFGGGVNISTNFTPQVFEGTILVEDNRLVRCGSRDGNTNADFGAVWVNTVEGYDNTARCIVRGNVIEDSTYQGISFYNRGLVENMQITDNTITRCGTVGIEIGADARGSAVIRNNIISDAKAGELVNLSDGAFILKD